jgi:hypothetical protein
MSTRMSLVAKDEDGTYEMSFSSKGEYAPTFGGTSYSEVVRQIHGYDLKDNDEESLDDDIYNVGLSEDEVLNELDYPDYVIYAEKGSPSMILNNDVAMERPSDNYSKKILSGIFDAGGLKNVDITDNNVLTFSYLAGKYAKSHLDEFSTSGISSNFIADLEDKGLLDKYDSTGKIKKCVNNAGPADISCQIEVALLDTLAMTNTYRD